tara:strand:- start:34595 stop:35002 length:408 start_codon:yes stop_codon:yes gene_type:complete
LLALDSNGQNHGYPDFGDHARRDLLGISISWRHRRAAEVTPMVGILAYAGIAGLVVSFVIGIIGFMMAVRPWPAYVAYCRKEGIRPGFFWSNRYLDAIEPESRRRAARRGVMLHGAGLAGAVIFFPFVILAGVAS